MKNLFNTVKGITKGGFVKKALIVGGTAVGLVIVGKLLSPKKDETNEPEVDILLDRMNETTDEE